MSITGISRDSIGAARALALGQWAGRGRVPHLRVFPHTKVEIDRSATLDIAGTLRLGPRARVGRYHPSFAYFGPGSRTTVAGEHSMLTGLNLIVGAGAELRVGNGLFNYGCQVFCGNSITIGDQVIIGPQVIIRDDDEHDDVPEGKSRSKPITIGNRAGIASRAIILKGVTIGECAIVAAGTVVTKDVPPYTLVGGSTGRVLQEMDKETIDKAWENQFGSLPMPSSVAPVPRDRP
jgi:acetyltransferase-like isoleucine patch superfamily enzyme